jgi:hypothetical protein
MFLLYSFHLIWYIFITIIKNYVWIFQVSFPPLASCVYIIYFSIIVVNFFVTYGVSYSRSASFFVGVRLGWRFQISCLYAQLNVKVQMQNDQICSSLGLVHFFPRCTTWRFLVLLDMGSYHWIDVNKTWQSQASVTRILLFTLRIWYCAR